MMRKLIDGSDSVYFMTLGHQCFNEIHPEVDDIPGGVQDNSNFHRGSAFTTILQEPDHTSTNSQNRGLNRHF
jgi:hypothetical protein